MGSAMKVMATASTRARITVKMLASHPASTSSSW